jgi:DhnA family fructose-bisphosphate aldolase class Ia
MARTMRMRRLFNGEDNKLLDVAIDHGVFNEDRFLTGIEGGPAPAARRSPVPRVSAQLQKGSDAPRCQ